MIAGGVAGLNREEDLVGRLISHHPPPPPKAPHVFYRSSLPLPHRTLQHVSGVAGRHRKQIGSKAGCTSRFRTRPGAGQGPQG